MDSTPPLTSPDFQRLQSRLSSVEFVLLPHDRWPLRRSPAAHCGGGSRLEISILDSSFNPPTLAHLALANSPLPPPSIAHVHRSSPSSEGEILTQDYDAKLLLLSVRNVDKTLGPNDVTYRQRLEMVALLAKDVVGIDRDGKPTTDANVAVAVIDEPRFVDKSRLLLTYLRRRLASFSAVPPANSASDASISSHSHLPSPIPRLTFLHGLDTLVRLFSPRYYESNEIMIQELHHLFSDDGDGSRVVCARRIQRSVGEMDQVERDFRALIPIREYIDAGQITLIDIGKNEQTFSSTELREKAHQGDESWKKMTTKHIADYILDQSLYIAPSDFT